MYFFEAMSPVDCFFLLLGEIIRLIYGKGWSVEEFPSPTLIDFQNCALLF